MDARRAERSAEAPPETTYSMFSIEEMERLLRKDANRPATTPLTARAVLEENRIAALRRREEKARVRAEGRATEVALLEQERAAFDDDIHKERSRREDARSLSDHYKDEIAKRAEARRRDMMHPVQEREFFPFTDGESLERKRKDLARAHMKDLLAARVATSARADPLRARPVRNYGESVAEPPKPSEVHSFNANYPVFLKKATEYATKLADPVAGRAVLQQRVASTYERLQRDYAAKLAERENQGLGINMNDSLTADTEAASMEERKKNAVAIRQQIEDQRLRREEEKKESRSERHGYYGPSNKTLTVQKQLAKEHANDLRRQIEVDKARAKDLREYELAQDRIFQESHVQNLLNDQQRASVREKKSKRVLKESWDQQVKMRQVRAIVQNV